MPTRLIESAPSTGRPGQTVVPLPRVETADALAGPWTVRDWLYLDRLRIVAGPEVDEARLSHEFGRIARPGTTDGPKDVEPLDILRQFVRVTIEPEEDDLPIVWHGFVELEEREAFGQNDRLAIESGRQSFVAFGLARLFENVEITASVVEQPDGETVRIGAGLPFNLAERSPFVRDRGNRSAGKIDDVYVFADVTAGAASWKADEALRHLLKHHPPRTADDAEIPCALVEDGEHLLDWYDVVVPTDRRTLKEVIDALISRRRGVGYYVHWENDRRRIELRAFSFNDVELKTADDLPIGQNPDTRELDFTEAIDVDQAVIRDLSLDQFDEVRAEGERHTSTLTLPIRYWWRRGEARFALNPDSATKEAALIEDWRPVEERDYVEANSQDPDYAALDIAQQELNDALAREQPRVQHVFARFRINPAWKRQVRNPLDGDAWHHAFPAPDRVAEAASAGEERAPQWNRGLRLLPFLLLQEGYGYLGDSIQTGSWRDDEDPETETRVDRSHLRPLVICRVAGDDDETRSVRGDKLNAAADNELAGARWAIHAHAADKGPTLLLQVVGGPQHFLAAAIMADPAPGSFDLLPDPRAWVAGATGPANDPAENRGLDFTDLRVTLSIEAQDRVAESWTPDDAADQADRPRRVLTIPVPEARCDWVVPGTVVEINQGVEYTTSGGFLRDDRKLLRTIARAAGLWYGKPRRTLQLSFRQIRNLVTVGDLITDVGKAETRTGVNTPVTAVTFDYVSDPPRTAVETNYSAIDFT